MSPGFKVLINNEALQQLLIINCLIFNFNCFIKPQKEPLL